MHWNYSPMHRTPSGDRRHALQKEARELARDARALQKVAARARLCNGCFCRWVYLVKANVLMQSQYYILD
jgi:hypothetical protein